MSLLLNMVNVIVCNNPIVEKSEDCLLTASGTEYAGFVSMTESGYFCKRWGNHVSS